MLSSLDKVKSRQFITLRNFQLTIYVFAIFIAHMIGNKQHYIHIDSG